MAGLTPDQLSHFITPFANPTQGAQVFNEGMDVLNRGIASERNAALQAQQLGLRGKEFDFERQKFAAELKRQQEQDAMARRKELQEGVDKAMTMMLDPAQHDRAMALLRNLGVNAVPFQDPTQPHPAVTAQQAQGDAEELPPAPPPNVADLLRDEPGERPNLGVTSGAVPKVPQTPGAGAVPALAQQPNLGAAALNPLMAQIIANPAGVAGLGPSTQAAPAAPAGPLPGAQPGAAIPPPAVPDEEGGWVIYDPKDNNRIIASFNPSHMRGDIRTSAMAFAREIGRGQLNPRFKELADLMAPQILPMLESEGYDRKTALAMFKDMVESAFQREQSAENAATIAGARASKAKDDADERIAARAWDQIRQVGTDMRVQKHLEAAGSLAQAQQLMGRIDPRSLIPGAPGYDQAVKDAGSTLRIVEGFLLTASGEGGRRTDADIKQISGRSTESWVAQLEDWFNRGVYGQVGTADYNNMLAAIDQLSKVGAKLAVNDYKALSHVVSLYAPGGRLQNERAYNTVEPYLTSIFTQYQSAPWYSEAVEKYGPQAQVAEDHAARAPSPARHMTAQQRQALLDEANASLNEKPPAQEAPPAP